MTTNHLVEGAQKIEITTDQDKTYPARLVGSDAKTDLALLKVDGVGDFPSVKLTTRPPGQCASVPGFSVQPQMPTVGAPVMSTSRFVPAADVTVMRFAPRSIFAAARTSSSVTASIRTPR